MSTRLLAPPVGARIKIDDEEAVVIAATAVTFTVRYDDGDPDTLTWDIGYASWDLVNEDGGQDR
jgi:hypothetical protein